MRNSFSLTTRQSHAADTVRWLSSANTPAQPEQSFLGLFNLSQLSCITFYRDSSAVFACLCVFAVQMLWGFVFAFSPSFCMCSRFAFHRAFLAGIQIRWKTEYIFSSCAVKLLKIFSKLAAWLSSSSAPSSPGNCSNPKSHKRHKKPRVY